MAQRRSTETESGAKNSLVGKRLRVTYQPATQDLPNGSMHFDDPETVEFTVEKEWETQATGTADDGRNITTPLSMKGRQQVRSRAADRDEGTFRQLLGYIRDLEIVPSE